MLQLLGDQTLWAIASKYKFLAPSLLRPLTRGSPLWTSLETKPQTATIGLGCTLPMNTPLLPGSWRPCLSIHMMTMTSFVITLCGQCCRRHVVGQRVVSDISVFRGCWSICACVQDLIILICYYVHAHWCILGSWNVYSALNTTTRLARQDGACTWWPYIENLVMSPRLLYKKWKRQVNPLFLRKPLWLLEMVLYVAWSKPADIAHKATNKSTDIATRGSMTPHVIGQRAITVRKLSHCALRFVRPQVATW